MTKEQAFIALRPLRFGTVHLQPGDAVPVEAGRDYRLMQRLGQIGPTGPAVPAAPQEEPLLTPYEAGSTVVFVAEDGTYTFVTFLDALEAPEEVQAALGLKDGDVVASVVFPEDPDNATFVSMASLLPEQPTSRLLVALTDHGADLAQQLRSSEELLKTADQQRDEAKKLLAEALESGQLLVEQLAEARTELEALRAAPAIPPDALQRLVDVKGVGDKLAPVILAALTARPEPPAPEVQPEG